ncbi:DUF1289 domain-containing protein [Biostraticola tofi]|uniref:Fe-S protein YdhL (DUF1289 family) n=1 Tax=Biostraticola tofi TaxID=466109 RepID=A0A4R3Z3M8_9GAMM|nr:DUF1289 domain-containing protein [Biostraticola tofi]TCV99752.1 hypothetical protein EDC52_10189 [Biostraticola tofi]
MPEQLEFFAIPSPCRGICQSDARGYCIGCLRSREERFNWMKFSDAQKRDVIRLCRQRALRQTRNQESRQDPLQAGDQPGLF